MATLSVDAITSRMLKQSAGNALDLAKTGSIPTNITKGEWEDIVKSLEQFSKKSKKSKKSIKELTLNQVNNLLTIPGASVRLMKKTFAALQSIGAKIVTIGHDIKSGEMLYRITYKGSVFLEGSENYIRYIFKKFSDIYDAGKKNLLRKYLDDLTKTGTGGAIIFKRIITRKSKLINAQEEFMSCAAACVRQICKDLKIPLTEKEIRKIVKTKKKSGSYPEDIGPALEFFLEKHKINKRIRHGFGASDTYNL